MRTLRLLPLLALLLAPLALAACGDVPSGDTPSGDTAAEARPARSLEVEDFAYSRHADGARVVTGKLYNASSKPVPSAMISVALYDAQNRRIGTLRVPVQDVPPGERRPFREIVDEDGVQGARVHSVLVL